MKRRAGKNKVKKGNIEEGRESDDERRLKLLSFPIVLPRAFHPAEREHGDA